VRHAAEDIDLRRLAAQGDGIFAVALPLPRNPEGLGGRPLGHALLAALPRLWAVAISFSSPRSTGGGITNSIGRSCAATRS
jgi:hypothetical protein